jgi:hypothetical protein
MNLPWHPAGMIATDPPAVWCCSDGAAPRSRWRWQTDAGQGARGRLWWPGSCFRALRASSVPGAGSARCAHWEEEKLCTHIYGYSWDMRAIAPPATLIAAPSHLVPVAAVHPTEQKRGCARPLQGLCIVETNP